MLLCFFVFFKQKTAYEMRISDWSSDVCSSDLPRVGGRVALALVLGAGDDVELSDPVILVGGALGRRIARPLARHAMQQHRPRQIGRASCRERVWQYV